MIERARELSADKGYDSTIRGLSKMEARIGIALVVMLAMALGRLQAGQKNDIRSLLVPARRKAA